MKDIYLLNYNNYYNRTIKKFDTLEEYMPYLIGDIVSNVNFVPNDGIIASQVINSNYKLLGTPDYMIVSNVGENTIESRWFVIESRRLTNGQYRLTLRRDVIADSLEEIKSADSYIYKATLKDSDPMILNSEGMTFNQIKKTEVQLKDYTNCPWIVGYISPDIVKDHGEITGSIEGYYDREYTNLNQYPFFQYFNTSAYSQDNLAIVVPYDDGILDKTMRLYCNENRQGAQKTSGYRASSLFFDRTTGNEKTPQYNWENLTRADINKVLELVPNKLTKSGLNDLRNQNGKILKIVDKYYKVKFHEYKAEIVVNNITIGSAQDRIIQKCFDAPGFYSRLDNPTYPEQKLGANQIYIEGTNYYLSYEEVKVSNSVFKYIFSNVDLSNNESPYGLVCMPYSDVIGIEGKDGELESPILNKESRLKIMQSLGSVANLLYDIQLVPYCPIRNLSRIGSHFTTNNTPIPAVKITNDKGEYLTSMLVASKINFSFSIDYTIKLAFPLKIENETTMYRLCSPNYQGIFEFNPAKFYKGDPTVIRRFNVDCSYKPYNPYIHIAPEFKGLYGKDFNDARGLICGGDFSIDRISDAWTTYQYNNKNYEKQFNRQIDSMELKQGWNLASGIVGGITGAAGGGVMGGLAGGKGGAIAGAGAGVVDALFNSIEAGVLGRDAINAAKDQFKYNNQNIQAQPYSLSKVSTLNQNNKLFPFLEYYTCTDEERESLEKTIKYEGMTVMRVDKIQNFIIKGEENFVKARLIRMSDLLTEDYHYVQEINNELLMGVYLNAN